LSVTAWIVDPESGRLVRTASTAPRPAQTVEHTDVDTLSEAVGGGLQPRTAPFDLEITDTSWAQEIRRLNPSAFPNGGNRWCLPLRSGEHTIGALILADRVSGSLYTVEELELLTCIGDQITSVMLNLRLATEVANAKELEAFRTMSTFFVHDLKNAAASLNLMLKNLPVHFDDPAFRADALRGIGNTTRRIEEIIERLSTLRDRPTLLPVKTDLNQLITDALTGIHLGPHVELSTELRPLPVASVDREQIKSVITNLVLNAEDALSRGGRIRVCSEHKDTRVLISVADNGCGMTAAFMQERLFRPFQSTKKKGLGIGLFQCRAIVQAHAGSIHVASEVEQGTTFTVSLPVSATP
jgi:putative PEP-CTERM system histidine kinase